MFILKKSILFACLLVVGIAAVVNADQIYVEGYNDNFGLLNPQTGAYTLIGVTSVRMGGMGFAADGNLYGINGNGFLYQINTATGNLTTIGNTGVSIYSYGMGATSDGTLYLVNTPNGAQAGTLYTIDPKTAQVTLVGNIGFPTGCNPTGDGVGNLYDLDGNDNFYKIDRTTGLGTQLGNANVGETYSLANTNGTMYALNYNGAIYTVNLTNGASTEVSTYNTNTVGQIYSAAVVPSSVPEASTLALGSLASITAGIGWLRRRRSQQ